MDMSQPRRDTLVSESLRAARASSSGAAKSWLASASPADACSANLPAPPEAHEIGRKHGLVVELQRLASLSETPGCLDTHLHELSRAAERLLGAERCVIVLLSEGDAAPDKALAGGGAGEGVLSVPIRECGRVIGLVRVSGVRDKPCFDHEDRWMLEIVTVYIGKSLQTVQLHNILQSRFAQLALLHSVDDAVGRMLAGVPDPARMVTILAKSFYREMKKAGFGANEIIAAASQIISELSASLKRHARRQRVSEAQGDKLQAASVEC